MKKNVNKQRVLSRLVLGIAAVVLGLSVYSWNSRDLLGNQMPMPFGYGISVILSGSMEPTLKINDLVVIRETDEVEEDDIIVYQSGNTLVIHRVQEINGDTVITKGDANNAADKAITFADVKGVLAVRIPWAGLAVKILRQPMAAFLILAAAVVLTELSYRRNKREDKQELSELEDEIRRLMAEIKEDAKEENRAE